MDKTSNTRFGNDACHSLLAESLARASKGMKERPGRPFHYPNEAIYWENSSDLVGTGKFRAWGCRLAMDAMRTELVRS